MKKRFLILIIFIAFAGKINAQVDPHFSQYYAFPLWLNPGMAGVMDGDVRLSGIYRNQWNSVMMPFKTEGFSADIATPVNLNVGVDFMNQSAGDGGYRYVTASLTIAYAVRFGTGKSQMITMGMRGGLLNRRFDPSKFQSGDQWDAVIGYNPAIISPDIISKSGASVLDLGVGLSYFDARRNQAVNLFGGGAVFHLTRPEDTFINNSVKESLPMRITVHGGARINVNERVSITPHGIIMKQGNAKEFMAGLFGRFNVTEQTDLFAGVNYRFKDAVSPFIGVSFNNFVLGASYDVNNSELGKAVTGTNSFEISLSYLVKKDRESLRYLSCPRF